MHAETSLVLSLTFLQYSRISTLSVVQVALWSKSVAHLPLLLRYWLWNRRSTGSPCFDGHTMATIGSCRWLSGGED